MAKLNITQVKSRIGSTKIQKKNLDALGLRKLNRTVTHEDSITIRGMIAKVHHLVVVEPVKDEKATKAAAKAETAPVAEAKSQAASKEEAAPAAKSADEAEKKSTEAKAAGVKKVKPETQKKDESK